MKLSELMAGYNPSPDYEGWVTNDDYVFAIDTAPGADPATKAGDFAVVEMGIAGLDAQLNPVTQDKQYIRAGQSTTKTGTQRTFTVTGDRYASDAAQDYCLSHKMKYGTGNGVVTNYLYELLNLVISPSAIHKSTDKTLHRLDSFQLLRRQVITQIVLFTDS